MQPGLGFPSSPTFACGRNSRRSVGWNGDVASIGFIARLLHGHRNLNGPQVAFALDARIMRTALNRFVPAEQFSDAENYAGLERENVLALVLTYDRSSKASLEIIDIQHVRITPQMPAAKVECFQPLFFVPKNVVPHKITVGS